MSQLRAALARIAGVFTGHRADDDLREELQAHLDMETAENIRRGMPPDEARRQAMLASGGLTQAAEAVRDQRGLPWIESVAADVRYAVRALRRSPGFAAVVDCGAGRPQTVRRVSFARCSAARATHDPEYRGRALQRPSGPSAASLDLHIAPKRRVHPAPPAPDGAPSAGPFSC